MNYKILFAIFVYILVAAIEAQRCPRCPQGACPANCTGAMDVGTNCTTARPRRIWYFDQTRRICRPLNHLGCGGNGNRWCSKLQCTVRCALPIG